MTEDNRPKLTAADRAAINPSSKRARIVPWALAVFALLGLAGEVSLDLVGSTVSSSTSCPTADPRPYCERHPSRCSRCPEGPGRCGTPIEWICCDGEGDGGCVAVVDAVECSVGWDIIGSCDWGQSTTDENGKPSVECFE